MVYINKELGVQNNRYWCYKNPMQFMKFLYITLKSYFGAQQSWAWNHMAHVFHRNKFCQLLGINPDTLLWINRRGENAANTLSLQELMFFKAKLLIFHQKLHHMPRNTHTKCEACLEAGSQHLSKVNCRGKTNSKLLSYAGFVCSNTNITTAILREKINDMLYTSTK